MVKEKMISEESPLSRQEIVKKEYKKIIDLREKMYDQDVINNPDMADMREALDVHNDIVINYANELIDASPSLNPEQKMIATAATILHDSGKLNSDLLSHHKEGGKYVDKILLDMTGKLENNLVGEKIKGIEITHATILKIRRAVQRHMNHPFLIKINKGKKFPAPKNIADQIVFDADMLANAGFKNVALRLMSESNMVEDLKNAQAQDITPLEASFNNVIENETGVRALKNIVLTDAAKEKIKDLVSDVDKIFNYLKHNKILERIQDNFSTDGKFNTETIKTNGGISKIKENINTKIINIGEKLSIDEQITNNFLL